MKTFAALALATMAAMMATWTQFAQADENKVSPIPVSTGMAFTFSHTFHGAIGKGVHVTMRYNHATIYNQNIGNGSVIAEPSNALLFFNFPGGFPIPAMRVAGNLAVYLAVIPRIGKASPAPTGLGELAFVLEPHCPSAHSQRAPICQYATAIDWAIITPAKKP